MDWTELDAFQALPRLSGLALSPDGGRLVTSVATLDPKKQKWVTALWEVDPTGEAEARRLTRSAKGEGGPVFTEAGDVLFVSGRPDPTAEEDEDAKPGLWRLPPTGEAEQIGSRPGGVAGARTAGEHVLVVSDTLPAATTAEEDAERRKARKDRKISAILHTGHPVRYWDHDLGPGQPRLLLGRVSDSVTWQDLTPTPGRALDNASYDVSADGSVVVTTWTVAEARGDTRTTLRALDTATGTWRVLGDGPQHEYGQVRLSPDGTRVAAIRWDRSTPDDPGNSYLVVLPLAGGAETAVGWWDRWPTSLEWARSGNALIVTADDRGAAPVFRVDLDEGKVTRLTTDNGAYADVQVSPDGSYVYALRSAVDSPPQPVRMSAFIPAVPAVLPSPAAGLDVPGSLVEVTAKADDGRRLRSWLAVPEGKGRHPLVVWVHGGPLGSWNAWSWRWNPWLLVAQGYAVLLPDPAMSTGYGLAHIRASWGDWGGATYTDVLRSTDAALTRADLDRDRTALMGGSFGGYMANWVAGHTDRFKAIVTHASLWGLERFGGTTDGPSYWAREMTPAMIEKNDPSRHVANIVTPMLVIHGDKDYRVPVGEALALWWDLCQQAEDPATMPHRFLYFPDENHWVLTPGHSTLWYETVMSFLRWHVLEGQEVVPDALM